MACVVSASSAFAQSSCFRVNGVRAAGEAGVTLERPEEFRGGGLTRSYLVLQHRRTLGGILGDGFKSVKIPVTNQNKINLGYSSYGLAFTYEQLAELFGVTSGSPAICAHWELSAPGTALRLTSRRSEEVCFRLGGVVRHMSGTRSGSVGVCQNQGGELE